MMPSCQTTEPEEGLDPTAYRAAMRELAAGVTIVTSGTGPHRRGLTATAVCSLSASPPALLACVNRDTECHRTIVEHGRFCINVLGDGSEALAARFAGRDGVRGLERFAAGRWTAGATGAPVLEDAIAVFECSLREAVESGTHTIFIGAVTAVRCRPDRRALVYRAGLFSLVD